MLTPELVEFSNPRKKGVVVRGALPRAQPNIDDDVVVRNAGGRKRLHAAPKKVFDLLDDIGVAAWGEALQLVGAQGKTPEEGLKYLAQKAMEAEEKFKKA